MPTEFTIVTRPPPGGASAVLPAQPAALPARPLPLAIVAGACMASASFYTAAGVYGIIMTLDTGPSLGQAIALIFLVIGSPCLLVAWKLWKGANWARFAAIPVAAVLTMEPIPFLLGDLNQRARLFTVLAASGALLLPSSRAYCVARTRARAAARSRAAAPSNGTNWTRLVAIPVVTMLALHLAVLIFVPVDYWNLGALRLLVPLATVGVLLMPSSRA